MKIIDSYLVRRFLAILVFSLAGFLAIFVIVDAVENLDRFIDASVPTAIILKYYLYSCPWFLNIGLPMAVLVATVFTVGLLAKRNELTAMKSAGISLYRIAASLIFTSVIISMGSFFFEDQLVTLGNQKRHQIEKERSLKLNRKTYSARKRNIFLQKSDQFHIAIDRYLANQQRAVGVVMQFFGAGNLTKRIDANSMNWDDTAGAWRVHTYAIREFHPDGFEAKVQFSRGDTLLAVNFDPDDISREAISPEEKNFRQLRSFIQELSESGVDTTRWEVNLHAKVSFAFTNLIVVLFAFSLLSSKARGGLAFGAGMSLFVILAYYFFIRFGQTLGYKGILVPALSAWVGNLIFSAGGIVLLIFARK